MKTLKKMGLPKMKSLKMPKLTLPKAPKPLTFGRSKKPRMPKL